MKKIMLVILIGFAFGQKATISAESDFVIPPEFFAPEYLKKHVVLTQTITIGMVLEYAEECYADTIRLEKFGDEEYLLMHEYYGEIFTKRQLEEKGYYYSYRWITNTVIDENNPMEFEYIFIGKPTLEGFIEWLETGETR